MTLKFKRIIFIFSFLCISHFLTASERDEMPVVKTTREKKKKPSKKTRRQEKLTPAEQKRLNNVLKIVPNEIWCLIIEECREDWRLYNLSLASKQFRNLILTSQLKTSLDLQLMRAFCKAKSVRQAVKRIKNQGKKKKQKMPLESIGFYVEDPKFSFMDLLKVHELYPNAFFKIRPSGESLLHLLVKSYLGTPWEEKGKMLQKIRDVCIQSPFYINAVDDINGNTVLHLVNLQDDSGIRSMLLEQEGLDLNVKNNDGKTPLDDLKDSTKGCYYYV
jgi:hypothetical protein